MTETKTTVSPLARPIALPEINGLGEPHPRYSGDDQINGGIYPNSPGRIARLGPSKGFDRVVRLEGTQIYFRLICIHGEYDINHDDVDEPFYQFMAIETDRAHSFIANGYYKNQPIYDVSFELKPGVSENGDGYYTHRLNILKATGDLSQKIPDENDRKYAWAVSYHNLSHLNPHSKLSPMADPGASNP